jgi:YidC/Oxa1 family membrane protein insertase
LRILPIIYLVSQLFNGKITQFGSGASQSKGQMVFMMYGLPVIFFFLFYNVPSGLLLYWTAGSIFQIGQQLVINATMKKKRLEIEKNTPAVNKNVLKFKGGKKKTR